MLFDALIEMFNYVMSIIKVSMSSTVNLHVHEVWLSLCN